MTQKTIIRVWHVNFAEVNPKRKFHRVLEQVSLRLETLASGTALAIERDIIWIKQKQNVESQKEIQKWELLKISTEKQIEL
jgi:hypothetical protein